MNHTEFVRAYEAGASVLFDGNIAAHLFRTGLVPREDARREVHRRTVETLLLLSGIALFFFVKWYLALAVLVTGGLATGLGHGHSARVVFNAALRNPALYAEAARRGAFRLVQPGGAPKRSREYLYRINRG
jgi:hypothetical protein